MKVYLNIFVDCKSKDKALSAASKLIDRLDLESDSVCAESYNKGGYVVKCEFQLPDFSWQQNVYSTISMAQKIGRSWSISGDIEHELDAWSNDTVLSSVVSLHLQLLAKGA